MSGQPLPPGAPLVSPILSTADPVVGATAAIGRAIKAVSDKQHQIVAGVITASAITNGAINISVILDTAPSVPVDAHTVNGFKYPTGARVLCLLYPPRGVIILGQISDTGLEVDLGAGIIQTVSGPNFGGPLHINDFGSSSGVLSQFMRTIYARDTGGHSGLSSTSFVTTGLAAVSFFWPASGFVQIQHKTRILSSNGAGTYQADVIANNVTRSTTPYGGSTNNSFNYTATGVLSVPGGIDICGFVTLNGPGVGSPIAASTGDVFQVFVSYAVTAAIWSIGDTAISATPSF